MTVTTENDKELLQIKALIALKRKVKLKDPLKCEVFKELSFSPIERTFKSELTQKDYEMAHEALELCKKSSISLATILDPEYPQILKEIYDPPLVLFYRGTSLKYLEEYNSFAVVGSRNADPKGILIAKELAKNLSERGVNIVSGLALGIDAAAHMGALESGVSCATAAVLGHGLALPTYPAKNRALENRILENGGVVISHFLPQTKPLPFNFLDRNRIVSGLSHAAVIIQATKRSGSLSTARHSNEQGRDVLVVPGSFGALRYEGSHDLIRQGASLINSIQDIELEYSELFSLERSFQSVSPSKIEQDNDEDSTQVLLKLKKAFKETSELGFDDLQNVVSDEGLLAETLLELELKSYIKRLPGMRYIRS